MMGRAGWPQFDTIGIAAVSMSACQHADVSMSAADVWRTRVFADDGAGGAAAI